MRWRIFCYINQFYILLKLLVNVFKFFFQNWVRPVLNGSSSDHCFGQLFYNFNFFTGCWASIIIYTDIFWFCTIPYQFFHQTASNDKIFRFYGDLFWLKTSYINLLNDGGFILVLPDSFGLSFDCFLRKNWLAAITNLLIIECFFSTLRERLRFCEMHRNDI